MFLFANFSNGACKSTSCKLGIIVSNCKTSIYHARVSVDTGQRASRLTWDYRWYFEISVLYRQGYHYTMCAHDSARSHARMHTRTSAHPHAHTDARTHAITLSPVPSFARKHICLILVLFFIYVIHGKFIDSAKRLTAIDEVTQIDRLWHVPVVLDSTNACQPGSYISAVLRGGLT